MSTKTTDLTKAVKGLAAHYKKAAATYEHLAAVHKTASEACTEEAEKVVKTAKAAGATGDALEKAGSFQKSMATYHQSCMKAFTSYAEDCTKTAATMEDEATKAAASTATEAEPIVKTQTPEEKAAAEKAEKDAAANGGQPDLSKAAGNVVSEMISKALIGLKDDPDFKKTIDQTVKDLVKQQLTGTIKPDGIKLVGRTGTENSGTVEKSADTNDTGL